MEVCTENFIEWKMFVFVFDTSYDSIVCLKRRDLTLNHCFGHILDNITSVIVICTENFLL